MSAARRELRIGTSGWSYPHWRGGFYPEGLRDCDRLAFYAEHFDAAEINNTFYQLPEAKSLRQWRDTVPHGFVFAVKASRFITHMKKLRDPRRSFSRFWRRIRTLDDRLGPVLFQLPPRWRYDGPRLAAFLASLPGEFRYAFEFRDRSWLNEECYALLAEHEAALCTYHLAGFRSPRRLTTDLAYVRLHGPAAAYQGRYDGRTLGGWARVLRRWRDEGTSVYCYLDNDQKAYAAGDALRLRSMTGRRRARR